jgi:hypothetical protein
MDHLEILLGEHGFRGRARRVRCFAHTINLTAKATLRQFEKKKGKKTKHTDNDETPIFDDLPLLEPIDVENDLDDSDRELDLEDLEDLAGMVGKDDDEDDEGKVVRDEEEIVNVFETLTEEEQERWKVEVVPLRTALYKVGVRCFASFATDTWPQQTRRIAFKVINSPTLLLPQWYALLESDAPSQFHGRSLPRDVSTRWNSTFDHLAAFLEMQDYVDKFTGVREHGLRNFELTKEEWDCVKQLVKVLQVRYMSLHTGLKLTLCRS